VTNIILNYQKNNSEKFLTLSKRSDFQVIMIVMILILPIVGSSVDIQYQTKPVFASSSQNYQLPKVKCILKKDANSWGLRWLFYQIIQTSINLPIHPSPSRWLWKSLNSILSRKQKLIYLDYYTSKTFENPFLLVHLFFFL